ALLSPAHVSTAALGPRRWAVRLPGADPRLRLAGLGRRLSLRGRPPAGAAVLRILLGAITGLPDHHSRVSGDAGLVGADGLDDALPPALHRISPGYSPLGLTPPSTW